VLHTRVSDNLAEDIRRIAEDLRVPASNLVRNVLEEVFDVVESVSDDVGDLFEDMLDEADSARERVKRARHRAAQRRRDREPASGTTDRAAWAAAEAEVAQAERTPASTPPPPPVDWYYAAAGESVGPVDRVVLQAAARAGRFGPDTLVWTTGMGEWKPARQVRVLEGLFGPPPVPGAADEEEGEAGSDPV